MSDRNIKSHQQHAQLYYHSPRKETEFLTCLLAAGNKKILAHPLSEAFLHLKWKCVRKFFWASLIFQVCKKTRAICHAHVFKRILILIPTNLLQGYDTGAALP